MTPIAFGAARRSATALSTPPLIATAIRPGAGAAANTGAIAFASASAASVSPGTAAASSSERPTSERPRPGASASTMRSSSTTQPDGGVVLAARGVADEFEPGHAVRLAADFPGAGDGVVFAYRSETTIPLPNGSPLPNHPPGAPPCPDDTLSVKPSRVCVSCAPGLQPTDLRAGYEEVPDPVPGAHTTTLS